MHQPRVHVQSQPRLVCLANGPQHQKAWRAAFWYFQQIKENLAALEGFNSDLGSYPSSSQTLVVSSVIQGCSSPPSLGFPTEQRTSPKVLSISAQQECAEGRLSQWCWLFLESPAKDVVKEEHFTAQLQKDSGCGMMILILTLVPLF